MPTGQRQKKNYVLNLDMVIDAQQSAQEVYTQGYTILRGLFTKERLEHCRNICLEYVERHPYVQKDGIFVPDCVSIPELSASNELKEDPILHTVLRTIFRETPYRFCGHSDVGINRVVAGWHKDILQGSYAHYQKHSPWQPLPSGETYQILKVAIYLEDHTDDDSALEVVPGSHVNPSIQPTGGRRLHPALGDVILFDQRITHRGMTRQVSSPRILLSFGFGVNNAFTDCFEEGTRVRQRDEARRAHTKASSK